MGRLIFDDTQVDFASQLTFAVKNSGTNMLVITHLILDSDQFNVEPAPPLNVAPGDSQVVTVTFRPTMEFSTSGLNLHVETNHLTNPIALISANAVLNLRVLTTVAGTGKTVPQETAAGVLAQLSSPTDVATDGSGNHYIADYGNSVIRKLDGSGTITRLAGTGNFGYSGDNGPASLANLDSPYSIIVDKDGNVFVADFASQVVRKIDPEGIMQEREWWVHEGETGSRVTE